VPRASSRRERAEQVALRLVGLSFLALAAYVGYEGVVSLTGRASFDPLLALGLGVLLLGSILRELQSGGGELLWPEDATCPHPEHMRLRFHEGAAR
jgi:hypothetical protein